jgi:divalent metal cation (Fe/Co/Zn/Cd) transporter
MEKTQSQQDRFRRLAAAAFVIFSICFAIGLFLGYVAYGAVAGAIVALLLSRPLSDRIHPMEYPRGSIIPVIVSLVLVFALALISIGLWDQTKDPVIRIAIGLLPAPAIAASALFIGHALGKLDDLQRRIQTEGIALGFGIFFVLVSIYAWLTLFGLPQVSWIFATPALALCWVIGKLASTLRYR